MKTVEIVFTKDHHFHLKNEEENTCMGIKDDPENRLILRKCDNSTVFSGSRIQNLSIRKVMVQRDHNILVGINY